MARLARRTAIRGGRGGDRRGDARDRLLRHRRDRRGRDRGVCAAALAVLHVSRLPARQGRRRRRRGRSPRRRAHVEEEAA